MIMRHVTWAMAGTVCAVAGLLASCTSSTTGPAQDATTTARSTASAPAPQTPSSATVTRTATQTVSAAPSPRSSSTATGKPSKIAHGPSGCMTSHLKLREGSSDGAGGTAYITWHLINTATTTCTLYGYPGFAGLSSAGHVAQHPAQRNAELSHDHRKITVTLHPGEQADFIVTSIDNVPAPGCPHSYPIKAVQAYPPNQTEALRAPSREDDICDLQVGYVTKHS